MRARACSKTSHNGESVEELQDMTKLVGPIQKWHMFIALKILSMSLFMKSTSWLSVLGIPTCCGGLTVHLKERSFLNSSRLGFQTRADVGGSLWALGRQTL